MVTRISDATREACAAAWDDVLARIEAGELIDQATAEHGLNRNIMVAYARSDPALLDQWRGAREASASALEERALATASNRDLDPAHARVYVDTLKWAAAKRNPDHYSDRTRVDVRQTVDFAGILARAEGRLAELRRAALTAQDVEVLPSLQLDRAAIKDEDQ